MGGSLETLVRKIPGIGDPIADFEDKVAAQHLKLSEKVPIIGGAVSGLEKKILGTIGQKEEDAVFTTNTALDPEPRVAPTEIPLPEEPVTKRRRAAKTKQTRRGRASTILTALNDEPLGGG